MATPENKTDPKQPVRCPRCAWRGEMAAAVVEPNDVVRCPGCDCCILEGGERQGIPLTLGEARGAAAQLRQRGGLLDYHAWIIEQLCDALEGKDRHVETPRRAAAAKEASP